MSVLLKIKDLSLKAWVYVKKYWYVVVGFIALLVVGALTLGKHVSSVSSIFDQIEDDHDREIKQINDARASADAARAANEASRQKKINEANKQHVVDLATVDAKQKADAERMAQEQGDDPSRVAEDLAKSLNVPIVK